MRNLNRVEYLVLLLVSVFIFLSISLVFGEDHHSFTGDVNRVVLFKSNAGIQNLLANSDEGFVQLSQREGSVVIEIVNSTYSTFADTHSMEPLLDEESIGIEITPSSTADVSVGDIISYRSNIQSGKLIIHRVISIDYDGDGMYYVVKGDNNKFVDPEKVRFEQIEGILVGLIY